MQANWLIPDWPAPQCVKAVFTTRQGGVSGIPFDSMNLGDHVRDAPDCVASNRALLQREMGMHAVFLNQVHGNKVLSLDGATPNGLQADACVTTQHGLACTIMVADCLPVLLTSEDGRVIAAAHAGWRGLAGVDGLGVLESVFDSFLESFRALAQLNTTDVAIKIIAWLGPCIGPSAFEVGDEVKVAFESGHPAAGQYFVPTSKGKYLADLAGLARLRLQSLGITRIYGNDGHVDWCTESNPSRFFSHRRDAGAGGNGFQTTGRMAASIWLA